MIPDALKERAEWLRNLPARMGLRYCNRPAVRAQLHSRHEAALALHRPNLPKLSEHDQGIVDTLDRDGVAITSLDALGLFGSEAMVEAAAALANNFSAEAHRLSAGGQNFIIVPPELIVSKSMIFNWGVQDRLLDIVEGYIGLPPAYDGVAINFTVADGREISTRCWHQDWEDRRMLKVAVYLHDVDDEGGPFEVLRRNDTAQSDRDGYTYELAPEAELERRLGASFRDDIVSCTGLKGTVVFADTARLYHRGKPATARDRHALFYSYFAQTPRHPFYCERTGITRRDRYKLAESLARRQKNAITWRKHLPMAMRSIPPATI